jgi:cytochrome c553
MQRAAARPDGGQDQVKHFYRLLTGEAVLGLLILVWVGVFTALPPARIPPAPVGIQQTSQADDLSIALNIDPGRVGVNTFTATITANGQPLKNAQDVEMEFTSLSGKVAFSKAQMRDLGNGTYRLQGGYLGVPDQWDVKVAVTRPNRYDAYGIYQINLNPTTAIAKSQSWQPVALWLLVLAGVLYILAFVVLDKHTRSSMGLDTVPFVAIILGALIIFFRPIVSSNTNLINPVPPNEASVLAGKALYQQNCQVCHGATGIGDGPLSATLSPKPADLSIHGLPGIHTDGQLYYWISTGVPNTAMPAFGQKLSDRDIWNLVNFVRTLARP